MKLAPQRAIETQSRSQLRKTPLLCACYSKIITLASFVHRRGHDSATRNLSGVIICPAIRTAVIRRTPSPFGIIRLARWKSTFGLRRVPHGKTELLWDAGRLRLRFQGLLRGYDTAVNAKREKAIAARGAAVSRGAKQAVHPGQQANPMVAGNARQIHVSALFAVHVPKISDGSRPGVKARIAGSAAPGAQLGRSYQEVLGASSAGTAGTVAMTERAQQIFFSPGTLKKGYAKA